MKDKQYKNSLTTKQASEGIRFARSNAQALLSDAILLFENERYPRSISLSILAIEEVGKPSIIRSILLEDQSNGLIKEWKRYRSHTSKNIAWILPELALNGAKRASQMNKIFDRQSDHPRLLDDIKQLSFYTDVFTGCKWSVPDDAVDGELATSLISIAKILVGKDSPHTLSTEQELDLWVKYMKPVWKTTDQQMKEGLIICYKECEEQGLIARGMSKEMIEFMV